MDMRPTYCNPLSVSDMPSGRWLDTSAEGQVIDSVPDYRSIADPSVIYHDGKWIMYPSYKMAYVSEDFVNWKHVDIGIEHLRYSPAVVCFRDKWYLSGHSMSEVYCSDSPTGPFTLCGHMTDFHGNEMKVADGCYLADGDRLYFYWFGVEKPQNGENVEFFTGTLGVELDPEKPWQCITEPVWINRFDPTKEWQRYGEYNQNERVGYIEGQWMIKIKSRYYLLYSGSATQYSTYANGVMYSDEGPLSGFVPQKKHDPITEKRFGLLRGAGHGCITEGPNNTYWIFYTSLYNFNHKYERRIGMDPIGIDENGELYCPAVTETPQYAPGVLNNPEQGNSAGLLPLTFLQRPTASSFAKGREPFYATDDSVFTWWQPKSDDSEKMLTIAFGGSVDYLISSSRILWRDIGMDTENGICGGAFQYVIEYKSSDNPEWRMLVDASDNGDDLVVDYRTFDAVKANAVRLRVVGSPKDIEAGVTSITIFGKCIHPENN